MLAKLFKLTVIRENAYPSYVKMLTLKYVVSLF